MSGVEGRTGLGAGPSLSRGRRTWLVVITLPWLASLSVLGGTWISDVEFVAAPSAIHSDIYRRPCSASCVEARTCQHRDTGIARFHPGFFLAHRRRCSQSWGPLGGARRLSRIPRLVGRQRYLSSGCHKISAVFQELSSSWLPSQVLPRRRRARGGITQPQNVRVFAPLLEPCRYASRSISHPRVRAWSSRQYILREGRRPRADWQSSQWESPFQRSSPQLPLLSPGGSGHVRHRGLRLRNP